METKRLNAEGAMDRRSAIEEVCEQVGRRVRAYLEQQRPVQCVSVQHMEQLALEIARASYQATFVTWARLIEEIGMRWGRVCPECNKSRKCQRRNEAPIRVGLLLGTVPVGKPFFRCDTPGCSAPGLSVAGVLTGLTSGQASPVLKLEAARQGADDSYGKARRTLRDAPLGRNLERAKVRRLSLEVEEAAMQFAEGRRQAALRKLEEPGRRQGPEVLVLEGDGGKVRTGELRPLVPGESGFGKKTPVRALPKRARETGFRELITMDVRQLGEVEASALDVIVPVEAVEGEKSRRMLALAGRKGIGDNTQVYGLGDMGSGLASAFEEAFFAYPAFWAADKKHTWDYIYNAASVLVGLDTAEWTKNMREAVLDRHRERCYELLNLAEQHRMETLPETHERCPLHALRTYLRNNWDHMHFKEMEGRGWPTVSARAEAQVRDRTKDRFAVAGAWKLPNIEGKATLRSIIDEGAYGEFVRWYATQHEREFTRDLESRLSNAVADRRLRIEAVAQLLDPSVTVAQLLAPHPKPRRHRTKSHLLSAALRRHQKPERTLSAAG